MGGGGMGGSQTTTTTTTPSPFDIEKADTARMMRQFLLPNIISGMQGQATQPQKQSVQNFLQAQRYTGGRYGIGHNDPMMEQGRKTAMESLTKPNEDMMAQAMKMYGMSQAQGSPSSQTTTQSQPGTMQYLNTGLQMALLASLL